MVWMGINTIPKPGGNSMAGALEKELALRSNDMSSNASSTTN